MSFLRRMVERRGAADELVEHVAGYGQPGYGWWDQGMVWRPGSAGVDPNGGAMRLSAVFACQRILTDAISTLPLDTFYRKGGTRLPYRPRPDYLTFERPRMARTEYVGQIILSLLNHGNAYVATPRDRLGVPTSLVPLDPALVSVERATEGPLKGRVVYRVAGIDDDYTDLDVLHVKGLTLPGRLTGVSPITAAREVLEAASEAQGYGAAFFANHAVPPAVISMPGTGGAEDKTRAAEVAETWRLTNGGRANAGKVGVLIGGAELKTVAVSPQDAQWLETRRFGVQEIARIYGVPPHLIADSSNSTSWGSGLAEQNLAFGQFSLRPWIERFEEAHSRLLTTHGAGEAFVRLNLDALLRASTSDRYYAHQAGISARFLTINEVRALEDLPPVPWGDQPVNVPAPAPPGATPPAPPADQQQTTPEA